MTCLPLEKEIGQRIPGKSARQLQRVSEVGGEILLQRGRLVIVAGSSRRDFLCQARNTAIQRWQIQVLAQVYGRRVRRQPKFLAVDYRQFRLGFVAADRVVEVEIVDRSPGVGGHLPEISPE